MPKSHDQNKKRKYDIRTAWFIAGATAVLALIDQAIVPEVEINPVVYGIMVGTAMEAYPGIVRRLNRNNKK